MTLKIDLTGHTVLVTGATGQLGRMMVKTLGECGASVAIHYKNSEKKALELMENLKQNGTDACTVQGDVSSLHEMADINSQITKYLDPPDIIVTNAVSQIFPWETVLNEQIEDYENQFKTCVLHNVNAAKIFVPYMQQKKWGRFIGINTECIIQNFETQSAYVSGKGAMDKILRVLAKEIGPDQITVNQIAPGWTISERDRKKHTEEQPQYTKDVPLRRRGTDREISNLVAFLASDLASFITGTLIPVTGGKSTL